AISGKLLGAKDYKKLWLLSVDISKYAIVIALILMGVCNIFYDDIGLIFNKQEAVLVLFSSVFWIVLLMQPVNAIDFMFDGIFKGLGETVYLRYVLLAATFIGFTPTLLLFDYIGWKLHAIWVAFYVWMIVRSTALVKKLKRKYVNAI